MVQDYLDNNNLYSVSVTTFATLENTSQVNTTSIQLSQEETACRDRRNEVQKIFDDILKEDSYLVSMAKTYKLDTEDFKVELITYKIALIAQWNFLPAHYDHPLRAARAKSSRKLD